MNYYNEFDPLAAAWLRELILQGLIPYGDVDTRSIEDVEPREIAGYTQCHFFAGIGGWPLALQLAGWPDDRPIWTGSCPCQPFSAAGQGAGFADERHLWPAFHWLIEQCRSATVVGEQVASAAVGPWIDLVLTDLEALGYAVGAYAGPAAGVGAPHLRDRSYWVGHANSARPQGHAGHGGAARWQGPERPATAPGVLDGLADADSWQRSGLADGQGRQPDRSQTGRIESDCIVAASGELLGLADADCSPGGQGRPDVRGRIDGGDAEPRSGLGGSELLVRVGDSADESCERLAGGILRTEEAKHAPRIAVDGRVPVRPEHAGQGLGQRPGPTNGHWRAADWLGCRDGKWRPVESGTFPLAHGLPARVGRLRGYGNAIVPQQAAQFIKALMEYQCSPN